MGLGGKITLLIQNLLQDTVWFSHSWSEETRYALLYQHPYVSYGLERIKLIISNISIKLTLR